MNQTEEIQRSRTTTLRKLNFSLPRLPSAIVLGIEGFVLFALYYLEF